ncbi:MAG: hypothetical protein IPP71_04400 [Bacteroidetes bacterium]|nr:hypothetical protein [Bacteroidota bacterium]
MKINKNNYEAIFIDYYNGNLSAEHVADLFLFLESNPDLKAEFESFNNITIRASSLEFPQKEKLKKGEVNQSNFSQYMIAFVEGDCAPGEIKMLEEFIKTNPIYENEFKLFQATKLVASNEAFPGKNDLKKPIPMGFNFAGVVRYAVAAILLLSLIAGAYFMFVKSNEKPKIEFALEPTSLPATDLPKQKNAIEMNSKRLTDNKSTASPVEKTMILEPSQLAQKRKREIPGNNISHSASQSSATNLVQPESIPVAYLEPIQIMELPLLHQELQIQQQPLISVVSNHTALAQEKYMTVLEVLRQVSDRKLQKMVSNDNEAHELADDNVSSRNSVQNFLENGIEKVSKDKVSISTATDLSSGISSFSFAMGNFKIEKDMVK